VVGNPFRPAAFDPAWRTAAAGGLARAIYEERAFDRLPILADALEDAGCDNLALLNHLRADGPHRVECWALRRLLRTTLLLPGGVPMTFAYCPPGTFLMGSEYHSERPPHCVMLTQGFYAGIYPVTQQQWRAIMPSNPSRFLGDNKPVESVSWHAAQEFSGRVALPLCQPLRLPSEAEWEYACRAGSTTDFNYGEVACPKQMNYNSRYDWNESERSRPRGATTEVGTFRPNAWGLFDCHGNVEEWCKDWYDSWFYEHPPSVDPLCLEGEEKMRITRGGSWDSMPEDCHSAAFDTGIVDRSHHTHGFRVVFTA
jgi:formylglycine-generating enzyme required for sulfatase activity